MSKAFSAFRKFTFLKKSYLFLVLLGRPCCTGFSQVAESRVYSLVAVCRLLIAIASLAVERGL